MLRHIITLLSRDSPAINVRLPTFEDCAARASIRLTALYVDTSPASAWQDGAAAIEMVSSHMIAFATRTPPAKPKVRPAKFQ